MLTNDGWCRRCLARRGRVWTMRLLHLCLVAFAAFGSQRALATPPPSMPDPARLIVDTDMAFDDWLALYLLARRAELLAVTISGTGETYCDAGIGNARYLLRLAGKPNVPVACGRTEPLNGFNSFPLPWRLHASEMRARAVALEPARYAPVPLSAVSLMQQVLSRPGREVRIVALGPLTNVADLLRGQPAIARRIKDVYIMGGAVEVPGNIRVPGFTDASTNTASEWNFYVDPAAASVVLGSSGLRKFIVPLDATRYAPLRPGFLAQLRQQSGAAAAFFADSYEELRPQIESGNLYFWDVSAALCATSAQVCRFEQAPLVVVEEFADPSCPRRNVRCDYAERSAGALAKKETGAKVDYAVWLDEAVLMTAIFETLKQDKQGLKTWKR